METTAELPVPPIELLAVKAKGILGRRSCLACHQRISGPSRHVCAGQGRGRPGGMGRKTRFRIAERDSWICQLCGEPVDPRLPAKHPFAASLDHRLPRAEGGKNGSANLQLAHTLCNILRATTPLAALNLADLRVHFERAWARYLMKYPHASPEEAIAQAERRRVNRRAKIARRRERRATTRMVALIPGPSLSA